MKRFNYKKIIPVILFVFILIYSNVVFAAGTDPNGSSCPITGANNCLSGFCQAQPGGTGECATNPNPSANPDSSTVTEDGIPAKFAKTILGGLFGIGNIAASAITFVAQVVGSILGFLAGAIISIGVYLIVFSLNINKTILTSPTVLAGWGVVLGFANLGFILAIIVMAFGTIFRIESYSMKQMFWKLIIAALLVNFSMVIAGAFIDVANTMSDYFIGKGVPGGANSPAEWAKAFSNMFKIGGLSKIEVSQMTQTEQSANIVNNLGGATFNLIASVFFIAIFTIIAASSILTLALMFLVRYLYLSILIILSPIVWLFWIFPGTQQYWHKWWSDFIKWALFAPISLFFMYLALYTMYNRGSVISTLANDSGAISAAGGTSVPLTFGLDKIGELLVVLGLVYGGIVVANSMSGTGAKIAVDYANKAKKVITDKAGQAGLRGANRITGSERMKSVTDKLATSRVPGARFVAQGINRLGSQVESKTKKPYEELAKDLAKDPKRLNTEILASRGVKRAVLLNQAVKDKEINERTQEQLFSDPKTMEQIQSDFKVAGLNFGNLEKTLGRSLKMVSAKTDEELKEATDEFVQSISPKDYGKGQWKDIFKKTDKKTEDIKMKAIQKELIRSFIDNEPGAIAKVIPMLNGRNRDTFKDSVQSGINSAKSNPGRKVNAERAENTLKGALGRRYLYGEETATPKEEIKEEKADKKEEKKA